MNEHLIPDGHFDPNAPVSAFARRNNGSNDLCETAGVPANRAKVFEVLFQGGEVNELLEILRRVAVASDHYQDVARAVHYERLIYEQARQQGF